MDSNNAMDTSYSILDASQLIKMEMDVTMDDSLDGGPPSSVGSGEIPSVVAQFVANTSPQIGNIIFGANTVITSSSLGTNNTSTPTCNVTATINTVSSAVTPVATTPVATTPFKSKFLSKKTNKSKVVTGYILYSREVRKQVVQNNPESKFGDISRIVGSEWKALPASEKQHWEEKASKLNEESKAMLLAEQERCGSPAPPPPTPAMPPDHIFECLWDNCDFQFEELSDLIEHSVKDSKDSQGHVQAFYQDKQGVELQCQWKNCMRINKKNLQPFPNMTRLIRHVRDMHINKGNGRSVPPENRNKNFKPSSKPAVSRPTPSATPNPPAAATASTPVAPPKIQEPVFISVPPRPQRVLHSEAYIKYIEGLQAEQRHITQWERTLNVTPDTVPTPDPEKLQNVAAWLGKRADQHDNVVAALWTLRNQLLKDTLCLQKTL